MVATEDEIREMLNILDQYRYRAEMMGQQLSVLTTSEQELGIAWDFLESFPDVKKGSKLLIPIGGGVMVAAKVEKADKVLTAVGNDLFAELDPKDAAQRIGERRDRVREMMQQIRAAVEQVEAQAQALSEQAEAAFQGLQASREGPDR
jgi:prefoldin alpha subunit